ncbi:alpha/beta hydrolase [Streptomyces sp. Ru73]|uniref:alpha/beta fold hydrolase n=1 Tax=Streptomyces sp. Ru73 TaxID=2080748 RepID=UPI000CDD7E69|nr:alpha/beta hydrolase [Streptomyces sp. Ru73]POX37146.1 alpha/beta hydrolase [Streptomyces sp. Ru73]
MTVIGTGAAVAVPAPARLGAVRTAGGRRLAWAEWGPEDGVPVLLCPGAGTSRRLGFGAGTVEELGVRLISVDRPGLGASDSVPGRTLTGWAEDVREFAARRGLEGLRGVGFSQGAPFALACAAAGVLTRVALVSGTDELAAPACEALLPDEVRYLVGRAAADPVAAERSFAGFGSPEGLYELIVMSSGERDRALLEQPAFAAAFQEALAEGFAQGPAGYARDTLLTMSRWPFDPADVRTPVDLWYGALDAAPTHSPDHGARLAARLPTARRRVVPEAGGMLLWTHAASVLGALLDA